MSQPGFSLLYVGDPMCSWCWGFSPVLARLLAATGLPCRVMVGGLRAGPAAQPLDDRLRVYLRSHWEQVEQVSGQPFERAILEWRDWVYDTELACRAVVAMRELAPDAALPFFEALQRAFYVDAADLTRPESYPPLAAAYTDPDAFMATLLAPDSLDLSYEDFAAAHRLGVHGFPSLLLLEREVVRVRLSGYRSFEQLMSALERTPGLAI